MSGAGAAAGIGCPASAANTGSLRRAPPATLPHARLTRPVACPAAVSVDGVPTKAFASKAADPVGGWWTAAPGASPQAPFDQPFAIIL